MKCSIILSVLPLILFICSCGSPSSLDDASSNEEKIDCNISSEISYAKDVVPILQNNCYECHNDEDYAKKADGHKLFGYESFKKEVDEGMVKGSILHSAGFIGMPYRRKKLDTCDISLILNWVEQGAKNN